MNPTGDLFLLIIFHVSYHGKLPCMLEEQLFQFCTKLLWDDRKTCKCCHRQHTGVFC